MVFNSKQIKKMFLLSLLTLVIFNLLIAFHMFNINNNNALILSEKKFEELNFQMEKVEIEKEILLSNTSETYRNRLEMYSRILKKYYEIASSQDFLKNFNQFIEKIKSDGDIVVEIHNMDSELIQLIGNKNEITYENFENGVWNFIKYVKLNDKKVLYVDYKFFSTQLLESFYSDCDGHEAIKDLSFRPIQVGILSSMLLGVLVLLTIFLTLNGWDKIEGVLASNIPLILILVVFLNGFLSFEISNGIIKLNLEEYFEYNMGIYMDHIAEKEGILEEFSNQYLEENDNLLILIKDEIISLCDNLLIEKKISPLKVKILMEKMSSEVCKIDILSDEEAYWIFNKYGEIRNMGEVMCFNSSDGQILNDYRDVYNKFIVNAFKFNLNQPNFLKREVVFYYPLFHENIRISVNLNDYLKQTIEYREKLIDEINFESKESYLGNINIATTSGTIILGSDFGSNINLRTAIDSYTGRSIWELLQLNKDNSFKFLIKNVEGSFVELSGICKYENKLHLYFIYIQ